MRTSFRSSRNWRSPFEGCFGVTCLPAFWLSGAAPGIRNNLVFVYRCLRCRRACIAAVMIQKSLRMGKTVLQLLDNSVFFSKRFFILFPCRIFGLLKTLYGIPKRGHLLLVSKDAVFQFYNFCGCFFRNCFLEGGDFFGDIHSSGGIF